MIIKKKGKIILTVIIIILLIIILSALIMISLAFTDDNTDKYNSLPSNELAKEVAMSAVFDNEAYITEESLNSFIAYLIQQANNSGVFGSDCTLNALYIEINSGTPSHLYFQITYKERDLGFSADINAYFDEVNQTIKLSLDNAYVGRLKIPNSLLSYVLSKINFASALGFSSVDDLTITLPTHYSLSIDDIGTIVEIDIINLNVDNGEIYIQTNPIAQDTIDNILGILGGLLGDKIGSFAEGFGDLF